MGIDSIAALNNESGIPTPHLDTLLSQGMHFTDAHSGSSVCSPTRYGVLTGRYSWRSRLKKGIVSQWERPLIEEDRLTLPKMLKKEGYHTACIGKWHLGWNWPKKGGGFTTKAHEIDYRQKIEGGPTARGFDYYFGDDVPNWQPFVWIENDKTLGIPSDRVSFAPKYHSGKRHRGKRLEARRGVTKDHRKVRRVYQCSCRNKTAVFPLFCNDLPPYPPSLHQKNSGEKVA